MAAPAARCCYAPLTLREGGIVGVSGIAGFVAALVVGGAVGTATIVGVVNSQTGAPSKSPVNVEQPIIEYGATS